jgi:hypothetical protein
VAATGEQCVDSPVELFVETERVEFAQKVLAPRLGGPLGEPVSWWRRLGEALGLADLRPERLATALTVFQGELEYFATRPTVGTAAQGAWAQQARLLLEDATAALESGHTERGWNCLSAAQRMLVHGLFPAEQQVVASVLQQEADAKLDSWRRKSVADVLQPKTDDARDPAEAAPLGFRVFSALAIRDESFNNAYFKLNLVRGQLRLLATLLSLWVLTSVVVVMLGSYPPLNSTVAVLGVCAWFGVLGALFSGLQSTAALPLGGRIPEKLATASITLARIALGAPAAVMAAAFVKLNLLPTFQQPTDSVWLLLVLAFASGFSERLVLRALKAVEKG